MLGRWTPARAIVQLSLIQRNWRSTEKHNAQGSRKEVAMSEKRKKAQTESAPKKNTNINYSKIENICLVFAVTFLI